MDSLQKRFNYKYEIEYMYDFFISNQPWFPEPSLFTLVLGGEGSSWDETGMWHDNAEPAY